GVEAGLEPTGTPLPPARVECLGEQPPVAPFDPDAPDDTAAHRRDGGFAVRLGLAQVKGIGTALAQTLVAERERGGPYRSLHELVRRTSLTRAQLEALATADAFACFGLTV